MNAVTRVLLVGETWMTVKFNIKGVDIFPVGGYENYATWFMDAMRRFQDLEIEHMPNHVALGSFPATLEQLNRYDVVMFSDVGKNTLMLYPDMFTVPMGPDRLALVKEYVTNGKSFAMGGGWNSFQGLNGIPGYHGTVIEEILPVEIQATDDRVETPQGTIPEILVKDHPIFRSLPAQWSPFLGYNRVTCKPQAELLATIGGNPFIATQKFGKGRTLAFTSDLTRHWGTGFLSWEGYGDFWHNTFCWLAGR